MRCGVNQEGLCGGYGEYCPKCEYGVEEFSINKWAIEQKMRFDLSSTFISAINFILLISLSLQSLFHVESKWVMICFAVGAIFLIWLFGWIIDAKLRYLQHIQKMQAERNPIIMEILENTKREK